MEKGDQCYEGHAMKVRRVTSVMKGRECLRRGVGWDSLGLCGMVGQQHRQIETGKT